jgi:hypothetical protein
MPVRSRGGRRRVSIVVALRVVAAGIAEVAKAVALGAAARRR